MIVTKEKDVLFEEILEIWLEEIRRTHAISTYVKYSRIVKNYLLPHLQGVPIKQITPAFLRKFSEDLKQILNLSAKTKERGDELSGPNAPLPNAKADVFSTEHGCSYTSVQTTMMIANMVMKWAFGEGIIHEWSTVPYSRKKKKTLVQVLSLEEQTKLERYIKKTWNQTGFGIYLCLYTGMRLGEICALKWENIHIQEGYITICATVQRLSIKQENGENKSMLFLTSPKSDTSLRKIPFPSFLMPVFEKKSTAAEKEGFFLQSKSKGPMDPRTFQYQYKRFLQQAGIPYYNFHTLRHTFATRCITAGMDPKTVSEILGHSDIKITMDYYFHSSFEFKKNQIEKLAALV